MMQTVWAAQDLLPSLAVLLIVAKFGVTIGSKTSSCPCHCEMTSSQLIRFCDLYFRSSLPYLSDSTATSRGCQGGTLSRAASAWCHWSLYNVDALPFLVAYLDKNICMTSIKEEDATTSHARSPLHTENSQRGVWLLKASMLTLWSAPGPLSCIAFTKISTPRTVCLTMRASPQVPKFIASHWRQECHKAAASESADPIHLGKVRISKNTGRSSVRLACQAP